MVTITEVGAERVHQFLESRESGLGIRVKITTTGCSGYAYQLEFADEANDDDNVFESNGVKILVDPKSLIEPSGILPSTEIVACLLLPEGVIIKLPSS